MSSKNFIFTALFFGILFFCISCLENPSKKQYEQTYSIFPTDSSNFTISLEGIETIKTPTFDLEGKWKLVEDSVSKTKPLYLTFEGRKVYSTLYSEPSNPQQNNKKGDYQVFAIYNKCPDEEGIYNKNGNFLVIGSGDEKLICYKVISYEKAKIILYDTKKGEELEFRKIK